MRHDKPCCKDQWNDVFLIEDKYPKIVIDGIEMTAKNIWDYPDREALLEKLVDYFFQTGFKLNKEMEDTQIEEQLLKLKTKDSSEVLDARGNLKNTSPLCLDVCRHFCQKSFYNTRVNGTPSLAEVYKDKDLLRKVLKNRMGWFTTSEDLVKEDGTVVKGEKPYIFGISHKMIIQGCHSSMVSANVSNFRPLIAKFLYERYCKDGKTVLDLSAGWGARFLAAWSLGKEYYGIDPMTTEEILSLADFISAREKLKNLTSEESMFIASGSEEESAFEQLPEIDYTIVCPPYFKLEEYSCEKNSTDVYSEYKDWLETYWRKTCQNAYSKMKSGAKFTLIMVEKWDKYELLKDMSDILKEVGFTFFEELSYKTTRSHLTDKRKSGKVDKATEKVVTFVK